MGSVHPAIILLVGSILLALLPTKPRRVVSLLLPILSFVNLLALPEGTMWHVSWGGFELVVLRIDRLSLLFGYLLKVNHPNLYIELLELAVYFSQRSN